MAKQKLNVPQLIPLPPPMAGLDTDSSFTEQRKQTTPVAKNCRPFDSVSRRHRLSRRAGFSKFTDDRTSTSSGQDIFTATVAQGVGTGDFLSFGATSTTFNVYDAVQADSTPDVNLTVNGTPTAYTGTAHSMGCSDEDNNFYIATAATRTITLQKFGTDSTSKWGTVTLVLTAGGSPGNASIVGLAAFEGVVYLMVTHAAADAIASPGIYRFKTKDGSALDNGPWKLAVGTTGNLGTYTMPATVLAAQCIAVGTGVLHAVVQVGSNLVCQQWNVETGALILQTTLAAFNTSPAKIVLDRGNNPYILSNATVGGTAQVLYKVDTVIPWSAPIAMSGAVDIAYDPIGFQIGVVGNDLRGTGFSVERRDATTGTLVASSGWNPNSVTTWAAIAATGVEKASAADSTTFCGSFLIRRGNTTTDLLKIDATTAVNGGITQTLSTGLASTAARYWLAAAGNIVAPLPTYMQSTRTSRILTVAGGVLGRIDRGEYTIIKSSFASSSAPVVYSTVNHGVVIYVDGTSYLTYDLATNVAGTLTASAGELPADPNGLKCRLCTTWRGGLLLSGLITDPQNLFHSRDGTNDDFEYTPTDDPTDPTRAWALNESPLAGLVADDITALIPHTDNMLIIGCGSSIYRMTGSPVDFGRVDPVTDVTGIAWGRAFCSDPSGVIYFWGSQGGVYRMGPAGYPQLISIPVGNDIWDVDQSTHLIRMVWDSQFSGLHIVIAPLDATENTVHYWWDERTNKTNQFQIVASPGSWWTTEFTNPNHNSLALCVLDGDAPGDRVILWYGRDGYVRFMDRDATSDDGTAIVSEVWLGPLSGVKSYIADLPFTMAADSGNLSYSVHSAESVEAAFNAVKRFDGTFTAGRNHSQAVRSAGHAHWVKLFASAIGARWSVEKSEVTLVPIGGLAAQRQF